MSQPKSPAGDNQPKGNNPKIPWEDIQKEFDKNCQQEKETQETIGLFLVRTANRCIDQAKSRPIPEMLFGEFWYEGELCILFADTNLGKSILAVQIGDIITRGEHQNGITFETRRQTVLYFDFELSEKQFENRYSKNFEEHYIFDDTFFRVEINPEIVLPEKQSFESYLNQSLELSIVKTNAKILIIDNLTYLKNETERAKDALPLMKFLKSLKSKYGLSILALAHTPKRDLSKPITKNDLQGSKTLMNFCDSAFSIGESQVDKSIRYLKQIKVRQQEFKYDADNVFVCEIVKPHNYLNFEFKNYGTEREHLKVISENEQNELETSIKELLQNEPTITAYAIAKKLCTDESKFASFKVKVTRIVNKSNKAPRKRSFSFSSNKSDDADESIGGDISNSSNSSNIGNT